MATHRLALIVACALARAVAAPAQEPGLRAEAADIEVQASEPAEEAAATDPCALPPDQELLGLDWTRRALFDTVCTAARWVDRFFGKIRYDEAAPGLRGHLSFTTESREDSGVSFKPRFRVRIPLPNLNKRLSIYFEREDEAKSIEGRNVGAVQPVQPAATAAPSQDTTQVGFAYRKIKLFDQVVDMRLGIRAPRGEVDYYGRVRYVYPFWRTEKTQWRFAQTFYWRHSDGWGETSEVDYENKLSERYLLSWYSTATWAQTTEGVEWKIGVPVYHSLGASRAIVIEPNVTGQTGLPYAVTSFGMRAAYRQTLGRPWLFGEIYVGQDRVKTAAETGRDAQSFVGFILDIAFEGTQRNAPTGEQRPLLQPAAPDESSTVQ